MSARLKSALMVGLMGAIAAGIGNFGRLSSGAMSPVEGLSHSAIVLVIAGAFWFLYDSLRKR